MHHWTPGPNPDPNWKVGSTASEASSGGISLIALVLSPSLCCCCMLATGIAVWVCRRKKGEGESFDELNEQDIKKDDIEKEGATAGGTDAGRSSISEYPDADRGFSMPEHTSTSLAKTLSMDGNADEEEGHEGEGRCRVRAWRCVYANDKNVL